jgi:hypothetical protein
MSRQVNIIKRRKTKAFVTLENELVRDRRLTLDEHGMLHYLLSLPDDWEVSREYCAKFWDIGRDKCARIFRKLRQCGWAQVERVHAEDGTFLGVRWIITDEPGAEVPEAVLDHETDDAAAAAGPSRAPEMAAHHDTENPAYGSTVTRVNHDPEKAGHGLYIDSKKTDSEENRILRKPDADVAPARDPLISKPALDLAEQLLVIAGHDPKFWPPGWCGAAMRVQTWLSNGWPPEIILAATKASAARKTGPPAASVQFFEKAIAEEIARQAAPLPIVEIRSAETLTVTRHGTSRNQSGGSLVAAINRQIASLEAEDGTDPALSKADLLLLPSGSIRGP